MGVIVDGTSKVAVSCAEVDEGYEFTYTPTAPGDYFVNIRYCNVNVAGSPFKVVVSGQCLHLMVQSKPSFPFQQ